MILQMQSRGRPFEGAGDKRVFDREEYSCNIDSFEVPQKLIRYARLMSSPRGDEEIDYAKLPSLSVVEPHENDVLMGRGGKNNRHSGNERLRQMARLYAEDYLVATKKGKSHLSRQLVQQMRELSPPARFLKRNSNSKTWDDVGDNAAREKASQVLRDAVAIIPEAGNVPDVASSIAVYQEDHEPRRSAPEPQSVERQDRIQTVYTHTPSLHSTTSESFPPPTPVTSSRKRHRYVTAQRHPGNPNYPVDAYESHPRHYEPHYQQQPEYRSTRQRLEQYSPRYAYSHRHPPHMAAAPAPFLPPPLPPQARMMGGDARGTFNEEPFDLFNCELLESDHEDEEPRPPGPRDDLF